MSDRFGPDHRAGRIQCAVYTHARRHPVVVGKIGGWTPPFQLTVAQIAVLLGTILVEAQTWSWWGGHLPSFLGAVVAAGIPVALTWSVRHARIEGRSPLRAAAGWLVFLTRARGGRVGGRPNRPGPRRSLGGTAVFVAAGELGG